jgi:4-hydroxybenzoate polyprenyltransferase
MVTRWRTIRSWTDRISNNRPSWLQLTRTGEHVPFVVPLTLLGGLLAARATGRPLDIRMALIVGANALAVAYAFMINDVEDAPDDAADPTKAARNVVSRGALSVRRAQLYCGLAAVGAAALYLMVGGWAAPIGLAVLALSHLYSWRPIRLKSLPLVDVLSHSLMLGGLLVLAGSAVYPGGTGAALGFSLAATAISAYGQLYNQLRDFHTDQRAGLRNTIAWLGPDRARLLMYAALVLGLMVLLGAIAGGSFPLSFGIAIAFGAMVSLRIPLAKDMRGGEAVEVSGRLQSRGLITLNIGTAAWLTWILAGPWLSDLLAALPALP